MTKDVAQPIMIHISDKILGKEIKRHKIARAFFQNSNRQSLGIDASDVLEVEGDALAVGKLYQEYSDQLMNTGEVAKIITLYQELKELGPQVRDYLQEALLSRSYIYHTCQRCLGKQGI